MRNPKIFLMGILCGALGFAAGAAEDQPIYQERFEGGSARNWSAGGGEVGGKGETELADGAGIDDSRALLWHYDMGDKPAGCVYSRCRANALLPGKPVRMKIWIFGDNSNLDLQFRIQDATGKVWQNGIGRIDWEGWRELDIPIAPTGYSWGGEDQPDKGFLYPVTLTEFMLDYSTSAAAQAAHRSAGTLAIDDLTVYQEAVDEEEF